MHIGIPRETKPLEGRVALVPEACGQLVRAGHSILLERDAGLLSGYPDALYRAAGAHIAADAASVYQDAELIIKVKEPQPTELPYLRREHLLFCFLHLAADPELARQLQEIGLTAVAFETVEEESGSLPILAPMSDIAGRIASQVGTTLLHRPQGGKGLLLGGVPAAERGRVVVLGAGNAGSNAARVAAALGAEVVVFDRKRARLAEMRALGNNVTALYPYHHAMESAVAAADLLIGAILQTGSRAAHLITREMVKTMQPGSVVVDISVDQGGCIETTRPTTYADPTYVEEGMVHFTVTNMPGAVPRTATQALSAALIPHVLDIAQPDWRTCNSLLRGINVEAGNLVHPALKESFA
ncbi:MAG: alanine dehydrogenase [Gammaproteobacteria bacterium]|jgi:alanine dehydrogenase